MRGTLTRLIHIEYGFAAGGTLDYLKVWSCLTRGHWLLRCEYWMSANRFHAAGISFDNGNQSEGLTHNLEVAMQHQNSFVLPRTSASGTAPDLNAYVRRKRSGRGGNRRGSSTGYLHRSHSS
jgi:hypothetical protein